MNEIWHSFEEGNVLYALIWRQTDDQINIAAGATFEVYVEANIDNYDHVMLNQGDGVGGFSDYYSVDFPSAITTEGTYRVQIMLQAGGSIDADLDTAIAQGELYWNGTSEDTLISISGQLDGLTSSAFKKTNIYGQGE